MAAARADMMFGVGITTLSNYTRSGRRKLLILFLVFGSLLFLSTTTERGRSIATNPPSYVFKPSEKGSCSPKEYSSGRWVRRPYWLRPGPLSKTNADDTLFDIEPDSGPPVTMTKHEDILKFARFEGCASNREYWLQLGADIVEMWDRFPRAHEWEWVPAGQCGLGGGLREWDKEEMVRDLVEKGGWLLIGDSVTENHFFSLSCLLYPHVVAVPDYQHGTFDRGWPQNLFLNPTSPLLQDRNNSADATFKPLRLPPGFDIAQTPLVTYRRVDLLWSRDELSQMHRELHPEVYEQNPTFKLFSDDLTWTMSPDIYLDIFTKPLPQANYAAMIVSTAGHWTTGLFLGYHNPDGDASKTLFSNETEVTASSPPLLTFKAGEGEKLGYDGVLNFFGEVMDRWGKKVKSTLDSDRGAVLSSGPAGRTVTALRQVIIRPYFPGHADCHSHREPWSEIHPWESADQYWNWADIWKYNRIFEALLAPYERLHFLKIDKPARLRPDAHSSHDCLHLMSGAGVLEGWTHYVWHYLTREL
ncbi:hypothetical protein FA13DRAFT_1735932 [Coprinellus micaceus]|uniref:Uncharacterized protein n=1 Tax=Coprinellus micaceus TaxID=71717 RepID=A0A4Y7T1L4_COPMI|nr:hypothetical protein FA13DRAFT_1735932 [Coprinellus micaceus]